LILKTRLWRSLALLPFLAALPLLAVDPPLVDCPATGAPGDTFGSEGFYVPSFPGKSLKDVTLQLLFPSPGIYGLSLTARAGSYGGAVLGTASTNVSVGTDRLLPVTFSFAAPAVTPGTLVAFSHEKVSGPAGSIYYGVQTQLDACPVVQVNGFSGPLSTYRRNGIAIRITGDPATGGVPRTITIPAAASIHGANNTFFHSDLYLFNRYAYNVDVTATFHCYAGQNCGTGTATFTVPGYGGKVFPDVIASLFHAPETAGAIELTYRTYVNDDALHALSRVYTPSAPNPTNGAAVPGVPAARATGSSIFVGAANNGGNRAAGFRTNAGAYNPYPVAAQLTFAIYRNDGQSLDDSKNLLGKYTATWGPNEAKQVNDIFAAAGIGGTVTTDAFLYVYSDIPVIPYITVIDNVTGDSVVQGPTPY
jgi:hypothetical protein